MAATGTPTPNLGLMIPQGTDPASVDDINYNSNLLDTKIGAVGNDSVQDQIDSLNSKLKAYSGNTGTAGAKFNAESRIQQSGPLVFVIVVATATSSYGNSDIVVTVPSGVRPTRSTPSLLCSLYRGSSILHFPGSGNINTDGNVYEGFTGSSGQNGDVLVFIFAYTIE